MIVYRITTDKWCRNLQASGNTARWNSKGNFMIYSAGSRALACLENIVHRSGEMSGKIYKVMLIAIPASLQIQEIKKVSLHKDWKSLTNYSFCQQIGNHWLKEGISAIVKVPSVIIDEEFNYLINPQHNQFKKIKLVDVEQFSFDARF
ncbi:MAG: RES family NAD+ phosphorylase [Ferruginibacter sp.]|nr:RES family NAD+ phosphorylase [Ferruginibacter sp.]